MGLQLMAQWNGQERGTQHVQVPNPFDLLLRNGKTCKTSLLPKKHSFCLVLGSAVPVNKKVAPFQLVYSGYIQTYENFQGFISPWLPSGNLLHSYGKFHHFSWENSLFLWPFSIAFCKFTRGYIIIYPIKSHFLCHWITIIYPIKTPFSWVNS